MYSLKERINWIIDSQNSREAKALINAMIEFSKLPSAKNYRHLEIVTQGYQEQWQCRNEMEANAREYAGF